jgi:arylsulfatase B
LGYYQKKYTPNNRGFDSFFGYYNGFVDYYNYSYIEPAYNPQKPGYDFRKNFDTNYDVEIGTYATDIFTDEATKIIQSHNKSQNPLFLMNHLAPHTGLKEIQ